MNTSELFDCLLVERAGGKQVSAAVARRPITDLGSAAPGEVLIEVQYSSLNYKDALASTGDPAVARRLPLVPGIDAAGKIVESQHAELKVGDHALVTGYELGTQRWGGFGHYIRVPSEWVVPLPAGLDARTAMIYGTAGLTAAMSIAALQRNEITPDSGEVLVTGASGGVGTLAVAMLAHLGYKPVAVSGKPEAAKLLIDLGAERIIGRGEILDASPKPLLKARWSGAIDTAGGKPLADILRATALGGCVAACGLVAGIDLPTTVFPFILRGVTLAGIDSPMCPMPLRRQLWQNLASDWRPSGLDAVTTELRLADVAAALSEMLAGRSLGRKLLVWH